MTTGYNTKLTNFTAMPSTSGLHQCIDAAIPSATRTVMRKNILEWLNDDAPSELLPKILSFRGSRKLNAPVGDNMAFGRNLAIGRNLVIGRNSAFGRIMAIGHNKLILVFHRNKLIEPNDADPPNLIVEYSIMEPALAIHRFIGFAGFVSFVDFVGFVDFIGFIGPFQLIVICNWWTEIFLIF